MNGNSFGFRKPKKKNILRYLKNISPFYIFFLVLVFSCFSFYNHIGRLVIAHDKETILKSNLKELSIYFWPIDKSLSQTLLTVDKLVTSYNSGSDILNQNNADILYLASYFQQNVDLVTKLGFNEYIGVLDFMSKALNYKEDLFSLAGKSQSQKYLIVFQNMSEKRPNGGFFGSFGVLDINNLRFDLKVNDSYYVDYISSGAYLTIPNWAENFLEDNKLFFVSVNKFGFTDIDGENIKKLYEKATGETVRGVIFVKSDLMEKVVPGFNQKIFEWQFVNASVDLIRGKNLPYKKEFYLKDLNDYIQNNYMNIVKGVAANFSDLIKSGYINVYLTGVSPEFQNFLVENDLTTVYNDNKLYLWDSNIAFNKIDRFVQKDITIKDINGQILVSTGNEIVDISAFPKGIYTIDMTYSINTPKWYVDLIDDLEKKYGIALTRRENHIFGLNNIWNTRGLVYLPKSVDLLGVEGDHYFEKSFENPFSQNLVYKIQSNTNNTIKKIQIKFMKN